MSFFSQSKVSSPLKMYLDEYKSKLTTDNTHFDILKKHMKINQPNQLQELMNVHDNYETFKKPDSLLSGITEDSCILRQLPRSDSESHCVVNKETFTERFNKLSNNILNFFDWENIVIAGGMVNLALSHVPLDEADKLNYDIDMFVHSVNEGEAKKIMNRVFDSIKDIVPECKCVKTHNTVTVILPKPYRHIQFVTNLFESKEDLLHNFDLQSAKVLYDGKSVFTTVDGHFGLLHKTNVYTLLNNNPAYDSRLYKYSNRGYQVFVPGFDKNKVSNYVYKTSSLNEESNVLTKLLHYDKFGKNYSLMYDDNRYYMDDTNYLRTNLSSYNAVFFTRDDRISKTLENLQAATDTLLFRLKLRAKGTVGNETSKKFKVHDLEKFPVYKVYDNVKLAFIDENNCDPNLEEKFFMNGPTFDKSILCKYLSYNYTHEYYLENKEVIDEYYNKNMLDDESNFGDLYYNKVVDENIVKILDGTFNVNDLDVNTGKRDKLGRTYMQAAIIMNNVPLVVELLAMNYDIFERLDEGMTSIHFAIRKNKTEIVSMMLDYMLAHGKKNVKYYDNSGCNLIHYAIMFSNANMFERIHDKLGVRLSDTSWSVRFNDEDSKRYRRPSKYVCCAKLCMMYGNIDVLRIILNKYENFNDFRYIFVDSDLTDISTADIIAYAIANSDFTTLQLLCEFFSKNNIDVCIDYTKFVMSSTNLTDSNLTTLFMLEHYVRKGKKTESNVKLATKLVELVGNLFRKKQYTKLLSYVNKWLPDVWTSKRYIGVHDTVRFDNIFGNKYVDTDKSLRLFSAVVDSDWDAIRNLLDELQYNLYIYNPIDKTTVLSLCEEDSSKLSKLLKFVTDKVSNKTNTYHKTICDLLYVNYNILFDLKCVNVLLKSKIHNENILDYMHKNGSGVVKHVWDKCYKKSDYTELADLLVLLSKYKCDIDFKNLTTKTVTTVNKTVVCKHSFKKPEPEDDYESSDEDDSESDDESDSDSEEEEPPVYSKKSQKVKTHGYALSGDTDESDNEVIEEKVTSVIATTLYPTIQQLEKYTIVMDAIKNDCDENIFNIFDKNNFSLKYYVGRITTEKDFDTLTLVYNDIHTSLFLLNNEYHLMAQSWRNKVLDKYYNETTDLKDYNILEEYIQTTSGLTIKKIVSYLDENDLLRDHLSRLDFDRDIIKLLECTPVKYFKEQIKDIKGNTMLHSLVRMSPTQLLTPRVSDNMKLHNEVNDFGKTPQDYLETTINNTSKYDHIELAKNVKVYRWFMNKMA